MTIDLKTIKHISKLSRISVDDEKAKKLAGDMNSIFDFIEKLKELDTDNVEPLTSVAETTLKLRVDEVKSGNIKEQVLNNNKLTTDDMIEAIEDIITDCKDNSMDFSYDNEDHYGDFEQETDFTKLEIM